MRQPSEHLGHRPHRGRPGRPTTRRWASSRSLGTGDSGAHRGAVVVAENLLVEVVEDFLFQLKHHLERRRGRQCGQSRDSASRTVQRAQLQGPRLRALLPSGRCPTLGISASRPRWCRRPGLSALWPVCRESGKDTEGTQSPHRGARSPCPLKAISTPPGLSPLPRPFQAASAWLHASPDRDRGPATREREHDQLTRHALQGQACREVPCTSGGPGLPAHLCSPCCPRAGGAWTLGLPEASLKSARAAEGRGGLCPSRCPHSRLGTPCDEICLRWAVGQDPEGNAREHRGHAGFLGHPQGRKAGTLPTAHPSSYTKLNPGLPRKLL